MTRRRAGAIVLAALLLVAIGVWAIPNTAGRAFVDVRLIVTPVSDEPGAERQIALGGAAPTLASSLKLAIRIDGRYLLPVVVPRTDPPLRVELRDDGDDGRSTTIWSVAGSAAELEDGGDSPDDPALGRPVLVRPGALDMAIGPADGMALVDPEGAPLAAGAYVLQAWAFGIPSETLSLVVAD